MTGTPAFVVTIKRNLPLAQQTRQRLARQGVQAEIWMGVDGTRPIEFNPGESVDRNAFMLRNLRNPQSTEIGCYLSHYRLMQHALQKGWERILVFEDDALPTPHFKHIMPRILDLDGSYEYINLYSFHQPAILQTNYLAYQTLSVPLPQGHILIRNLQRRNCTLGYAISGSGLRKVLPQHMPISAPADYSIDDIVLRAGLRCFTVWPHASHVSENHNIIINRTRSAWRRVFMMTARRRQWRQHNLIEHNLRKNYAEHAEKCIREHSADNNGHPQPEQAGSGAPPAFVISNPAGSEQCQNTLQALAHLGIKAQAWNGPQPSQIQLQPDESIRSRLWLRTQYGRAGAAGVIAQYLSHYRLMQHALQQGLQRIIVMEAGAVPTLQFGAIASHLAALPESFELIGLSGNKPTQAVIQDRDDLQTAIPTGHALMLARSGINPLLAYTLSLQGIRKLLPLLMPIRTDIRTALNRNIWLHSARIYQMYPAAAPQIEILPEVAWGIHPKPPETYRAKLTRPLRQITPAAARKMASAARRLKVPAP